MKSNILKNEQKMESFYFSSVEAKLHLTLEKGLKLQLKPCRTLISISLLFIESLVKELTYLIASFNSLERQLKELKKEVEGSDNLRNRLENQEKIINGIDRSYTEQINELKERLEEWMREAERKEEENKVLHMELQRKEEVSLKLINFLKFSHFYHLPPVFRKKNNYYKNQMKV